MKRRLVAAWQAFLDVVLGGRCSACGLRVFPRDKVAHYRAGCRRWT